MKRLIVVLLLVLCTTAMAYKSFKETSDEALKMDAGKIEGYEHGIIARLDNNIIICTFPIVSYIVYYMLPEAAYVLWDIALRPNNELIYIFILYNYSDKKFEFSKYEFEINDMALKYMIDADISGFNESMSEYDSETANVKPGETGVFILVGKAIDPGCDEFVNSYLEFRLHKFNMADSEGYAHIVVDSIAYYVMKNY